MPTSQNLPAASPQVLQAKQRFGIIGNAPALVAAVERAIRVAPIDLSVLVTGESGSGKEFFPQIIHAFSARKHAKYIAVNCGAIPEGTIDSELFGHEKGAFTGAVDSRKGYFEEANGGTIFLDEVAELPLTTQARLLRVLESGEFLKVGSSTVQKTNIRIVAATNVDLVPAVTFTAEADDTMRHYRWPGNVRQLKNVVEQIALFEAGKEITPAVLTQYLPNIMSSYIPALNAETHDYQREREMLFGMIFNLQSRIDQLQERLDMDHSSPRAGKGGLLAEPHAANVEDHFPTSLVVRHEPKSDTAVPSDVSYSEVVDVPESLEEKEREAIRRALERNEGHRKSAAAELGISERTLYRKIKEYGMD